MAKSHRGKGLRGQFRQGRGVCPVCARTAVKVVYEVQVKEKTLKVCKICKAAIGHGKKLPQAEALVTAS
jgi:ribosome-binding protein aMBF1 (putative translation factor)